MGRCAILLRAEKINSQEPVRNGVFGADSLASIQGALNMLRAN